jgi:preprotein translocase subunit SecE
VGAEVKSMELKKTSQQASVSEKALDSRKVQDFVADIKAEIRKINWTNREELIVYTKIVVIATLAFGMAIYFLDVMIQLTLNGLSQIVRFISG